MAGFAGLAGLAVMFIFHNSQTSGVLENHGLIQLVDYDYYTFIIHFPKSTKIDKKLPLTNLLFICPYPVLCTKH